VFRDDGRIYRLRAKDRPLAKPIDLSGKKSAELVALLSHENKRVRRTALRLLGDRKDAEVIPPLQEQLGAVEGDAALEYLWALNLCGGLDETAALEALAHENPFVRVWTVRLLCDAKEVSPKIAGVLAEMARAEPNLEVRVQLACSARRLPAATGLPIVAALLARDEDKDDVFQPLLLWWAIEKNCQNDREAVLQLFNDEKTWERPIVRAHITQRLMRRFAATGVRQDLFTCARLFELTRRECITEGDEHARLLLAGFQEAYQGRSLRGIPKELSSVISQLGAGSLALRVRGGDDSAVERAIAWICDAKVDKHQRRELIVALGEVRQAKAIEPLLSIAESPGDDALRRAALGSLQAYDSPVIAERVLRIDLASLSPDVRETALALAASRPAWASQLLTAVSDGKIASTHVPVSIIRKILLHDEKEQAAVVKRLWGDIEGSTTDEMRAQVQKLGELVRTGTGDPYAGKKLYLGSCAKCHKLFEDGGDIGPDLTSYQRDNFEAMLLNVVNPSAEIREGFETFNVLTDDGRVLSGFVADQDPQVLTIREADGQSHSIPRESIESQKPAPRSIMPEKLLDPLSEQQIRDLFAYLRSRQPLND
jgi:putative heme-binding domain-containing protein